MFMNPHTYAYAAQAPHPPARQYSHSGSSAFSQSANPDEDWTKISDLAERRRIQNRIAQRNYRKKLKRRLEELERRAGTSDGASSSGNEKTSPAPKTATKRNQTAKSQKTLSTAPVKPTGQSQFTPPMRHEDEYLFPPSYDDRERSDSPPSNMFSNYSTYPPPPESMTFQSYQPVPSYRPMITESYPEYMTAAPVPVTLPSMTHFNEAIAKREYGFGGHDDMSYTHYSSSYIPGVDLNAGSHQPYDNMPNTPPLSHSYDHSAACSDSGSYEYPSTPLSMPGSPGNMGSPQHPQH